MAVTDEVLTADTKPTDPEQLASVSVVVATRGRGSMLLSFVEAALDDPATTELVIVLDGPDDDAYHRCHDLAQREPRVVVVTVEHCGQFGALDVGVHRATSEVILLADDDVIFGPSLVTGHARHHARRHGIVVLGSMPVEASAGHQHVGTVLYGREYDAHCEALEQGERTVLDGLWGGNFSLRRSDCLAVGVRSDLFPLHYHADQDFGIRLGQAGLEGLYDPALAAVHRHGCDDERFLRTARQQGASLVALHQVHVDRLGPFDRSELVTDLPRPLPTLVVAMGGSTRATAVARAVLAVGTRLGPFVSRRVEIVLAKLARRIMMWHGTIAGQGPPAPVTTTAAQRAA